MKKYCVIDVGGTNIKYALMDEDANILDKGEVETPRDSLDHFIEAIGLIYDMYKEDISGIAMSAPGRIDCNTGFMFTGGALRYIENIPMAEVLHKRCPVDISIENDGKCAALAELWKGSLKNSKHGLVLTLGTGIGGGVIVNGHLLRGQNFASGELSSFPTTILPVKDPINFWANINGTRGLTSVYEERMNLQKDSMNGRLFFEAVNRNEEIAVNVLEEFAQHFANAIFAIQTVLDTEKVAVGGGISSQDRLIEALNRKVSDLFDYYGQYTPILKPVVVRCEFANDSNLIGALYHLLYEKRQA